MTISIILSSKRLLLLMVPAIITACAINDAGGSSTPIPITLNAPVAIVVEGSCNATGILESWLQVTVPTRQQFQSRLSEAAAKNSSDVRDDTLYLATLRDTVARTHTPDCGAEVQNTLILAMNNAVEVLQGYYNRTLSTDVNTSLAEPFKGLNRAEAIQNDLITRMKEQYQIENNMTPTLET